MKTPEHCSLQATIDVCFEIQQQFVIRKIYRKIPIKQTQHTLLAEQKY